MNEGVKSMNNKKNCKFRAGIYARISKNNSRQDGNENSCYIESNESIINQILYCKEFLRKMNDVCLEEIYIDEGYSGVNFARPGFVELIQDIGKQRINFIIVKDFSRFGRNYIEVGQYLFEKFPQKGIRFISINDHYDSYSFGDSEFPFSHILKMMADDYYSFDISKKVRYQQKVKRDAGLYVGSYVVYGYKKSDLNPEQIEIDEEVRAVVKSIFAWKIEGMGYKKIADELNEKGILSPSAYKTTKGSAYCTPFQKYEQTKWYPATVEKIIKNRIYTAVDCFVEIVDNLW